MQGLKSWAWLPKFCRTFGVLCEGSSSGFLLCKSTEPSWGAWGPSFEDWVFFLTLFPFFSPPKIHSSTSTRTWGEKNHIALLNGHFADKTKEVMDEPLPLSRGFHHYSEQCAHRKHCYPETPLGSDPTSRVLQIILLPLTAAKRTHHRKPRKSLAVHFWRGFFLDRGLISPMFFSGIAPKIAERRKLILSPAPPSERDPTCPDLSLLVWKRQGKPPKKARIFSLCRTPKSPEKRRENAQKRTFLAKKRTRKSKKARKGRSG